MTAMVCEPTVEHSERVHVAEVSRPQKVSIVSEETILEERLISSQEWLNVGFICGYDALGSIEALEENGYELLKPIAVSWKRRGSTFEACFEEANICASADNEQDAYSALVAEILDTFDTLFDEQKLSDTAAAQLDVLKSYLVRV